MEELILQTYRNLKKRLRTIETSGNDLLHSACLCLDTCILEISELKKNIDPGCFTDVADQVRFFKELFPAFFSEVIYYRKLVALESALAVNAQGNPDQYVLDELARISQYLEDHRFLQIYVQSGKKHLDEILFTQTDEAVRVYPDTAEYSGAGFFNFNSFTVSKIRAFGRAYLYLLRRFDLAATDIAMYPTGLEHSGITAKNADFDQEKADIDKKLSWLEKQVNTRAKEMYLPGLRQRMARKRGCAPALELLLQQIREQKSS